MDVLHVRLLMRRLCNETSRCPSDAKSWQNRSERFNCGKLTYTCILTAEDTLVETCMISYDIAKNYAGCPVIRCDFGEPMLAPDEFAFCPGKIRGCPTVSHSGYSTDNIFKYPRCLLRRRDRFPRFSAVEGSTSTCNTSEIGSVVHIKNNGIPLVVVLPVVIVLILLLLIAFIFAIYFRRKAQSLSTQNNDSVESSYLPEAIVQSPALEDNQFKNQRLADITTLQDEEEEFQTRSLVSSCTFDECKNNVYVCERN